MTDQDAVAARARKAAANLGSAQALLDRGFAENAVTAMSFAGFHLAQPLLATIGIAPETHRGTQQMFSFHFVRGGALPADFGRRLSRLMDDRGLADYGLGGDITPASAAETRENLLAFLPPVLALLRERAPDAAEALSEVQTATDALAAA
ncbi:MAG: hypothetical protein JWR10_1824 [Rubritepida sp.]|nr:hypothetical protein [Rubritepida sp.]